MDAAHKQALGEAMGDVDFAYGGMREVADATDEIIFGSGTVLAPQHEARMTAADAVAAAALRRVLRRAPNWPAPARSSTPTPCRR